VTSLSIQGLNKSYGSVVAVHDLSLDVQQGEMLVLVGPSGCGKTTSLRCLAGLERPTSGKIRIGDRVVTAIDDGIFVPPERREIGMVFQSYAIWPHMTVFENVAYPLRSAKVPRNEIRPRVNEALELVQLEALADRYSSQISGGQQQRVALARSLVAEPQILLFDEPLSNLDASLRLQMRVEIKELQNRLGFTAVYVTHDQTEAMAIADRIAIMDKGVLQQIGSPRDIYERPANVFVAGFMGTTNLLAVRAGADANGKTVLRADGDIEVRVGQAPQMPAGETAFVSVRPEVLSIRPPGTKAARGENGWDGEVTLATFIGEQIIYRVGVGPHQFEIHARPTEDFAIGDPVRVIAAPERCILLRE
jgi:iron(III) transport system ATP-binding protein